MNFDANRIASYNKEKTGSSDLLTNCQMTIIKQEFEKKGSPIIVNNN